MGAHMKKKNFYSELAYVAGMLLLPLGIVFMEKANLGLSTVAAPAYLLFRKISPVFSFYTFGTSEFCLQVIVLIIMVCILRKFRLSFLFSFITTFLFSRVLDLYMIIFPFPAPDTIFLRIVFFAIGDLLSLIGVCFFFRTYISPEVYDIFVRDLAAHFNVSISRFKTGFDCVFAAFGIILSFSFYGLWQFEGVKIGTLFCAVFNGTIIGWIGAILDRRFDFPARWAKFQKHFL